MVRAHGYRVKGEGRHYAVFRLAEHLATDPNLSAALTEADQMRGVRHNLAYEAEDEVDIALVNEAITLVERVLNGASQWIREVRPGITKRIRKIRIRQQGREGE